MDLTVEETQRILDGDQPIVFGLNHRGEILFVKTRLNWADVQEYSELERGVVVSKDFFGINISPKNMRHIKNSISSRKIPVLSLGAEDFWLFGGGQDQNLILLDQFMD